MNGVRRADRQQQRRRLWRHVGRRVRQRHAAVEGDPADRRVRPSPHLPRPQSRSGEKLERTRADVQPAALVLGRLRSEEHTSELQSLMRISYAVFCLKKKTTINT